MILNSEDYEMEKRRQSADYTISKPKTDLPADENRSNTEPQVELNFITIDPTEFVQQCSLEMYQLFANIPLEEFTSSDYSNPTLCPRLLKLKQFKDRLMAFFVNEILRHDSIQNRVNVIHFLLQCASISLNIYSNFELIEVIYSALTLDPVFRLKQTFSCLDDLYPSQREDFLKMTGPVCRGLKKLKRLTNSYPVIPPVGSYCMDIRKLLNWKKTIELTEKKLTKDNTETKAEFDDDNDDDSDEGEDKKERSRWEKNPDIHLNMYILKIQDNLLHDLERAQETPYRFRWNPRIHELLKGKIENKTSKYCMDENVLYKRSRYLEAEVNKDGVFEI